MYRWLTGDTEAKVEYLARANEFIGAGQGDMVANVSQKLIVEATESNPQVVLELSVISIQAQEGAKVGRRSFAPGLNRFIQRISGW